MRKIGTAAFSGGDLSAIALLFGLVKMCQGHDELEASIKAGTENDNAEDETWIRCMSAR